MVKKENMRNTNTTREVNKEIVVWIFLFQKLHKTQYHMCLAHIYKKKQTMRDSPCHSILDPV